MFFVLIAEFEREAKIRKIIVYCFLISLPAPEFYCFKEEKFQSRKWLKNLSKLIKFVTSCAGHVDGIKN